jgi:hypothetical protein
VHSDEFHTNQSLDFYGPKNAAVFVFILLSVNSQFPLTFPLDSIPGIVVTGSLNSVENLTMQCFYIQLDIGSGWQVNSYSVNKLISKLNFSLTS